MVPAMWLSFPATRRPSDAESTLSGLLLVPRAEKGRSAATIPVRRRRGLGIPTVDTLICASPQRRDASDIPEWRGHAKSATALAGCFPRL